MFQPFIQEQVRHPWQQVDNLLGRYVRAMVAFTISLYQKFLSPIKGFSCAYRIYHKTESCSCYVKRIFLEQDLQTAITLTNQRFRDCMLASEFLEPEQPNSEHNQNSVGRRKVLQIFSVFPFFLLFPQARGGCPSARYCCASSEDNDRDRRN